MVAFCNFFGQAEDLIILYYTFRAYKIEIIYTNKGKNVYKMKKKSKNPEGLPVPQCE